MWTSEIFSKLFAALPEDSIDQVDSVLDAGHRSIQWICPDFPVLPKAGGACDGMQALGEPLHLVGFGDGVQSQQGRTLARPKRKRTSDLLVAARVIVEVASVAGDPAAELILAMDSMGTCTSYALKGAFGGKSRGDEKATLITVAVLCRLSAANASALSF